MSLGEGDRFESDAKFPTASPHGIPPSPSRENPGQVFPKSDPKAAPSGTALGPGGENEPSSLMGNPFAMQDVYGKLDAALNEGILALESEQRSAGASANGNATIKKFKSWRLELDNIRRSGDAKSEMAADSGTQQEGGLFTD